VFAAVKLYDMHPLTVRTVSAQNSQVIKTFDAWIHGAVPQTIVNAFREAGLMLYEESGVICLRVDRTATKKVCQWREAPHIEDGVGSAGKERVRLVEKLRPNSDKQTRLQLHESPRPDVGQFLLQVSYGPSNMIYRFNFESYFCQSTFHFPSSRTIACHSVLAKLSFKCHLRLEI
jgi:hypothetical protein